MLTYAVTRNKGAAILTGDVGLGKTTISRKLIMGMNPAEYKIVLIVNPVLTPNQMLMEVLTQLGVEIAPLTGGLIMTAWVAALLIAAGVVFSRRDA